MEKTIHEKIKSLRDKMDQNYKDFMNDMLTYEEFHWVQGQCLSKIKELENKLQVIFRKCKNNKQYDIKRIT